MRALSVHSPWANAIALGEKTIECRSWRTRYRGRLLICASARTPPLVDGYRAPYGLALATVDLVDCREIGKGDLDAAMIHPDDWPYLAGQFAWVLANAVEIEPFPVKGKQGLFSVDCDPRPLPPEYPNHFAWWDAHGGSLAVIRQKASHNV
jgi:hypothetical protein